MRFLYLFLLFSLFLPLQSALPASPPNIVFIMVDDLGYGDLSSYGAPDLKTPNIDALFASGMRFDQFYANSPVCSPTRAAFLSGRYPDMAGVPGVIRTQLADRPTNWGDLGDDLVLLPALLKKANYHSALIGKWHLGLNKPDRPTDRGFDLFHGFLGDMMDDYYTHLRHGNNYMRLNEKTIAPKGHATDLFSDWAIDYITDRATNHADQPFFLYLAYNAPHTPIQPPADWLAKVKAREKGITEKRAKIVALIEHLDHGTGRVLDALEKLKLTDNTLIVFTSDNGGHVAAGARNTPLHGGKQEMWEGGIRVCTAVSWPGKITAGSRSAHRSLTMDFSPTLAEIAGISIEHPIDARSFLPVLYGQPFTETRPEQVWVRLEGGRKYGGLLYHAIRIDDWKLLRNTPFEPYQMFNIANDPAENNPIPRGKAPKKFDDLFNRLTLHINKAGKVPWQRKQE
ncbi:MAG: sulfatase-like hydrolase/transferase [Verrucomicrobia bacterium]|nr:sulfatase-like hydrolase/transferase [Verrucomicrobiota bacterium]